MNNEQIKEFCTQLMKADTENDVVNILEKSGYWNNPRAWRYYGDKENNYSAAGNQADEAEAAMVEKITNSRDAILMNECMIRGVDPTSDDAPSGVKEAVADFFEENPKNELAGQVREWSNAKRREVAKNISVYITGNKPAKDKFPCLNIADKGEGQTPLLIPQRILSLGESIKRKIRFVHGKWNMGGTAALVYCGKRNLQFVISKRNPLLLKNTEKQNTDDNWGFTIVRREDPVGKETSSTYKYLAPIGSTENPNHGEILNFKSDTFLIFAKYNEAYSVESEWGTLIKLYEYQTRYKQNVQGNGGLLRPLDLLAPDLGLPFRLHECRYEGTPGSFEHQVNGLRVRLHDDRGNVLESSFPTSQVSSIDGEQFTFTVYAFKDEKAKTYRDSEKGVIFTLNGQTQGWLDDRIFSRNQVGLGFLKNSLLIIVDCSDLSYRAQEILFVNDRVHIRKTPGFWDKIEEELIQYLGKHSGLEQLQEERKRKFKSEKIGDSKPLETVLSSVFKHSSTLSKIFLKGERLSNAFKSELVKSGDVNYIGQAYPTFFKFKKVNYGEILYRDGFQNSKCRISFETDATNDYFLRKTKPGMYKLFTENFNGDIVEAKINNVDYGLNLFNGIGTLNINLDSQFKIGDKVKFILEVTDPLRIVSPAFNNTFFLNIQPEIEKTTGGKTPRPKPPLPDPGNDREKQGGVKFPDFRPVYESDWGLHSFNKYSSMRIVKTKVPGGQDIDFTFFINMDNIYLQHEIKDNIEEKTTTEAYFKYGMVLLGISVIYDDQQNKSEEEKYEGIEERIADFSRAMAPMLIPMIKEFGELDLKNELIEQLIE